MIFQIHEDHGKHIAYSPQEAETNIKNGWKTVSKDEFYNVPRGHTIDAVEEKSLRDTLVELYIEKFGEKPHHRMTEASIQSKLDE